MKWWRWVLSPLRSYQITKEIKERLEEQRSAALRAGAEARRELERRDSEERFLTELVATLHERRHGAAKHTMDRIVIGPKGDRLLLWASWNPNEIEVEVFRYRVDRPVCSVYMKAKDAKVLELVDISSDERYLGRGIGTVALTMAETLLAPHGYRWIEGWLSSVDANRPDRRRERQVRFYEKNGYAVKLRGDEGSISKELVVV